jgi:hypothetical protein
MSGIKNVHTLNPAGDDLPECSKFIYACRSWHIPPIEYINEYVNLSATSRRCVHL